MARLVWLVLTDGRSVVANCSTTPEALKRALARPGVTLTLTSDCAVERIAGTDVRDFVMFDARNTPSPESSIYHLQYR